MTIAKGSRYEHTPAFSPPGAIGFRGTRPRRVTTRDGVIEYTWRQGDRLDLVALHFYGDPQKWWLILDANPDILSASELGDSAEGAVILIPRDSSAEAG